MSAYFNSRSKNYERARRFLRAEKPAPKTNLPAPKTGESKNEDAASRKLPAVTSPVIAVFFLLAAHVALAGEPRQTAIPAVLAVRAIIGEAGNQGRLGMQAVAETIYRRGTLHGVYGVNNPAVAKASPELRRTAAAAWQQASRSNITGGATHWGNASDVQRNSFYRRLTFTCKIGDHYFFRGRV